MRNITITNTPFTGVWFASPQAADRRLVVGVRPAYHAPMHKAPAVKDVAQFCSWRPPA